MGAFRPPTNISHTSRASHQHYAKDQTFTSNGRRLCGLKYFYFFPGRGGQTRCIVMMRQSRECNKVVAGTREYNTRLSRAALVQFSAPVLDSLDSTNGRKPHLTVLARRMDTQRGSCGSLGQRDILYNEWKSCSSSVTGGSQSCALLTFLLFSWTLRRGIVMPQGSGNFGFPQACSGGLCQLNVKCCSTFRQLSTN